MADQCTILHIHWQHSHQCWKVSLEVIEQIFLWNLNKSEHFVKQGTWVFFWTDGFSTYIDMFIISVGDSYKSRGPSQYKDSVLPV